MVADIEAPCIVIGGERTTTNSDVFGVRIASFLRLSSNLSSGNVVLCQMVPRALPCAICLPSFRPAVAATRSGRGHGICMWCSTLCRWTQEYRTCIGNSTMLSSWRRSSGTIPPLSNIIVAVEVAGVCVPFNSLDVHPCFRLTSPKS